MESGSLTELKRNSMHKLHWLIPVGSVPEIAELIKSHLASIRLRAAPSIAAAQSLGWSAAVGENISGAPSIILIGKIGANNIKVRQERWLDQIRKTKGSAKILLDYTDHHLGFDSSMSHFYESAIKEVDGCIVPSKSMAELLLSKWDGPISIIEDSVEVDAFPPKAFSGHPVTLLWFGHSSNIDFLINFLSKGFNAGDHIRLIVLSNEAGLNHFANSNLVTPAKIEFNLALWSLDNMVEAAKIADMCIIPSDLSNPKKIGVSSNRLMTALTLGLPTAADNLPSYKEFAGFYCDLRSSCFREMLVNPSKFRHTVNKAQAELSSQFSMGKIQQDWKTFFLNSIS
jgi:hypothetical protein